MEDDEKDIIARGGYHATTAEFAGFDTERDRTGLGFFMTDEFNEASGRFCEPGGIILDIEGEFDDVGSLDDIIAGLSRPDDPGVLGYTQDEIEAVAEEADVSPAEAACRGMFGSSFNQAVAEEARVLGHDALELDAEPCWLIVLDTSKLCIVRRLDQEGTELRAPGDIASAGTATPQSTSDRADRPLAP